MPLEPDLDVATMIQADVNLTLVIGTDLFHSPVRGYSARVPHQCVFVTASGGLQSRPIKGQTDERRPRVDIRVRSNPDSVAGAYKNGLALARGVFDAVDQRLPTGYIDSRCLNSQPSYMGMDEDKHHEWVIPVQLIVDYTAP